MRAVNADHDRISAGTKSDASKRRRMRPIASRSQARSKARRRARRRPERPRASARGAGVARTRFRIAEPLTPAVFSKCASIACDCGVISARTPSATDNGSTIWNAQSRSRALPVTVTRGARSTAAARAGSLGHQVVTSLRRSRSSARLGGQHVLDVLRQQQFARSTSRMR